MLFERDPATGELTLLEVSSEHVSGNLVASPDGRNVYVSGSANGSGDDVASFARDEATGALTFLGKAAGAGFSPDFAGGIAVSPDGHDGVAKLQLRRGPDGRAAILLRGRGTAVELPELPFPPYQRIVAQLRSGDGTCWGAEYGAPATTHHASRFADRSD